MHEVAWTLASRRKVDAVAKVYRYRFLHDRSVVEAEVACLRALEKHDGFPRFFASLEKNGSFVIYSDCAICSSSAEMKNLLFPCLVGDDKNSRNLMEFHFSIILFCYSSEPLPTSLIFALKTYTRVSPRKKHRRVFEETQSNAIFIQHSTKNLYKLPPL